MAPDAFRGHVIFDLASPLLRYAIPGHLAFSISTHRACLISLFTPAPRSTQQASQRAPPLLFGRRGVRPLFLSSQVRGSGAPEGAATATLARRDASLAIGMLASRRSTGGVLVSAPGRAFVRNFPDRQRAPRGRLVVASRAEPRRRPSASLRSSPAGAAPTETGISPAPGAEGFGPHLRSAASGLLHLQDRL